MTSRLETGMSLTFFYCGGDDGWGLPPPPPPTTIDLLFGLLHLILSMTVQPLYFSR